jgi:hypothetical protein
MIAKITPKSLNMIVKITSKSLNMRVKITPKSLNMIEPLWCYFDYHV